MKGGERRTFWIGLITVEEAKMLQMSKVLKTDSLWHGKTRFPLPHPHPHSLPGKALDSLLPFPITVTVWRKIQFPWCFERRAFQKETFINLFSFWLFFAKQTTSSSARGKGNERKGKFGYKKPFHQRATCLYWKRESTVIPQIYELYGLP